MLYYFVLPGELPPVREIMQGIITFYFECNDRIYLLSVSVEE